MYILLTLFYGFWAFNAKNKKWVCWGIQLGWLTHKKIVN